MKKIKLMILFLVLVLTACDESDDSEGSTDPSQADHTVNEECINLESCSKKLFGVPAYIWPNLIENNFKLEFSSSDEKQNINNFKCGAKVNEVFIENFGNEPTSLKSGAELLFSFSDKILNLKICKFKADYKKTLLKIINKGN